MPPARPSSVSAEGDKLEAAIDQAQLSSTEEIAVWDTWEDYGFHAAAHVLLAMKAAKSPEKLRLKAIDPLEVAYQQLRQARATKNTAKIQAALEQITTLVMPAAGAIGAHLGDTEKAPVATKAALSPIEQLAYKLTTR